MFPTKFRFIWPIGFRGEEFEKSANLKKISPVVAVFDSGSGRNGQSLHMIFHRCFLPSFGSFGQVVSEKTFRNQPVRKKNCLWPCLLTDWDEKSNLHRESSIDASYQISIHLAKLLQRRRFFRNQPIRNKNCLWLPCLLTERN